MKYLTRDKKLIIEQSSWGWTTLLEGALLTGSVSLSCFQGSFLLCPYQLLWREVSSIVSSQLVAPSLVFSKHSFVTCTMRGTFQGRKVGQTGAIIVIITTTRRQNIYKLQTMFYKLYKVLKWCLYRQNGQGMMILQYDEKYYVWVNNIHGVDTVWFAQM